MNKRNIWLTFAACLMSTVLVSAMMPQVAHAQRHAYTWDFGAQCRMTWAADGQSFTATANSAISTSEGCTTFSDPQSGDLLLYSDGIRVWRADNTVILNGLGGNSSTMHSGVVIPAPGIPNHVYVLGNPIGNSTTLRFHLFDLTSGVAAPKGVTGTITLPGAATEGLVAVPHQNGIDQWLIRKGQNGAFVIPVTDSGFGTPVFYAGATGVANNRHIFGVFAISHDGRKVAHSGLEGNIGSFDFDPATGVLSNHTVLALNAPFNSQIYGGEFSPDNTKLYFGRLNGNGTNNVGTTSSITQYDYTTDTFTVISAGSPRYTYAAAKLGPDDKIYVASGNRGVQTLDVIDNPNAPGASVTYRKDAVTMPAGCDVRLGLTQTPSVKSNIATVGRFTNLNSPVACGNVTPSGVINAPDNTVVTVNIEDANGTIQGTCVGTSANYAFTCATPIALNASGSYRAVAQYASNNSMFSMAQTFTVDCDAPSITLTSPADGTLSMSATQTISGATESGAAVTVLIKDANGAVVQTLTPMVDAAGNYTIDTAQLADGTYTVEATATDASGNTSMVAGPNTITIDTMAPAIGLTGPADGTLTNSSPDITGTAEAGALVSVSIVDENGNVVATPTVVADQMGNWSIPTTLADGTYSVSAVATDGAGNTSMSVGPNLFTVDTQAPKITIANVPSPTNDNTPTFSGASDPATVSVVVRDDQGNIIETLNPTVDAQGNWTIDAAQLPDGSYTVEAVATDVAGNTSQLAGPIAFVVDTMAPPLTIASPTDGATTNDDTPTINGATEAGAVVSVTITDSNGNVIQTLSPTVDAMGNWTIDAAQLPEGDYTINATATDGAGNQTSQGPVALNIDLTAPALSITTPSMGELIGTRNVDVSGASEPNQMMIEVEIIDANGVVVDTQTVNADANGDWTLQTQGLANGDYTARAKTSDAAGNEATAEQTFTVDSDEPLITIDAPAADTVTNEVRPAINGTADTDGVVTVVVTDGQGNEVANVQPTVDAQGNWTVTLDADLADGDYTITATATRPNGKMASTSVDVTIDTMGPDTTITAPADGMLGNMNQPEITGTTEPGATVDVTVTNAAGTVVFTGQATADDQGNWSVTPDSPLADDEYTISATSTDAAGNEGTPATSTFTVDTNAPMVIVTSPANGDTVEDTTPTITGTAEPGATVTVIIDGMEAGQATADDQGNWSFDVTDELAEGDHTIEAKTTDGAGNEGSSGELTVTIAEPKAPVTITTPTDGGDVTGPDVTVTGTGEPGEEVTVTVGGETQTVTVDENGDWTVTFNDVPEGDQTIDAGTGDRMAPTVNVTVSLPEATQYLIKGGCASAAGGPTSTIWLLGLIGLIGLGRRRRKNG